MENSMQNNEEVQIYIATHKHVEKLPTEKAYIPIHVDAEQSGESWGYLQDNEGDNISSKNPNYCELTGLYWIWKNQKSSIVGLVHYRRYFFERALQADVSKVIGEGKIKEILREYDIILPKPYYLSSKTVKEDYYDIHETKDLELCGEVIKERHPEYLESFNRIMNSRSFYTYNMFITSWDLFDEYMNWLFDILEIIEDRIDISEYSNYNKRVYGFLAERLFNIWVDQHTQLKKLELNVNNTEGHVIYPLIKNKLKNIKIKRWK